MLCGRHHSAWQGFSSPSSATNTTDCLISLECRALATAARGPSLSTPPCCASRLEGAPWGAPYYNVHQRRQHQQRQQQQQHQQQQQQKQNQQQQARVHTPHPAPPRAPRGPLIRLFASRGQGCCCCCCCCCSYAGARLVGPLRWSITTAPTPTLPPPPPTPPPAAGPQATPAAAAGGGGGGPFPPLYTPSSGAPPPMWLQQQSPAYAGSLPRGHPTGVSLWKQLPQIARAPCGPGGAPFEASCFAWDGLGGLMCIGSTAGSVCTLDPRSGYPFSSFPLLGGPAGEFRGLGPVRSLWPIEAGIVDYASRAEMSSLWLKSSLFYAPAAAANAAAPAAAIVATIAAAAAIGAAAIAAYVAGANAAAIAIAAAAAAAPFAGVCVHGVSLARRGGLPVPLLSAATQQQLMQCCGALTHGALVGAPQDSSPFGILAGQQGSGGESLGGFEGPGQHGLQSGAGPVVCLLDVATGSLLSSCATHSPVTALVGGPSAAAASVLGWLPLGCADGTVRFLDVRVGALVAEALPVVSPLCVSSLSLLDTQLALCSAAPRAAFGGGALQGAPTSGFEEALKRCSFIDISCLLVPRLEEATPLALAVSSDGCLLQADLAQLPLLPQHYSGSSSSSSAAAAAATAEGPQPVSIHPLEWPCVGAAYDSNTCLLALCEWGGRVQLLQQQPNKHRLADSYGRQAAPAAAAAAAHRTQQQGGCVQKQQQQQQQQAVQGYQKASARCAYSSSSERSHSGSRSGSGGSTSGSNSSSSSSSRPAEDDEQGPPEAPQECPSPSLDEFLLPGAAAAAAADIERRRGPSSAYVHCSSYLQQQLQQQQIGDVVRGPLTEAYAVEEIMEEYGFLEGLGAPRLRGPLNPCCCTCVQPGSCSGGPFLKGAPCCCELLSEKWVYPAFSLKREDLVFYAETAATDTHSGGPPMAGGAGGGAPHHAGSARGPPLRSEGDSYAAAAAAAAAAAEEQGGDVVCGMVLRQHGTFGGAPCCCRSSLKSHINRSSSASSSSSSSKTARVRLGVVAAASSTCSSSSLRSSHASWVEAGGAPPPWKPPAWAPLAEGPAVSYAVEVLTGDDLRPPIPLPLALLRGAETARGWEAPRKVRRAPNIFGCLPNGALYGPLGSSRELVLRKTAGLLAARGGEGPLRGALLRRAHLTGALPNSSPGLSSAPWSDLAAGGGAGLGGPPGSSMGAPSAAASGVAPTRYSSRPHPQHARWAPPGSGGVAGALYGVAAAGSVRQQKQFGKGRGGDSSSVVGLCMSSSSSSSSSRDSEEEEATTRDATERLRASRSQVAVSPSFNETVSSCSSSDASPQQQSTHTTSSSFQLFRADTGPRAGSAGETGGYSYKAYGWSSTTSSSSSNSSSSSSLVISSTYPCLGKQLEASSSILEKVPSRYALHKLTGAPWTWAPPSMHAGGPPLPVSSRPPPLFGCFEGGGRRAFVRPLLQLFFFLPAFKETLTLHACDRDGCVACEVGYVLHTLELARRDTGGGPRRFCHTRNCEGLIFEVPEARLFGLSRKIANNKLATLLYRTQAALRFLLERLHKELRVPLTGGGPISPAAPFGGPLSRPRSASTTPRPGAPPSQQQSGSPAGGRTEGPLEVSSSPSAKRAGGLLERGAGAPGRSFSPVEALFALWQQTETVCLLQQHVASQISEAFIVDLQYSSGNKQGALQGAPQAAAHEEGPRAERQQVTTPSSSSSSSSSSGKGGQQGSGQGSLDQGHRSSDSAGRGPSLLGAAGAVPPAASQQAGSSSSSAGGRPGRGLRSSPSQQGRPCSGGGSPWGTPREEDGGDSVSFCSLLRDSLKKAVLRRAYCKGCGGNVDCNVVSLPLYLMLHANARDPQDLELWRSVDKYGRGFMRRRVWINSTDQDIEVVETETPGFVRYDLISSLFAVRPVKGPPGAPGGLPGTGPAKPLPVRSFAKATSAEKSAKHEKRDDGGCHLVLQVRVPSAYMEGREEEEASSFASSKTGRGGPSVGASRGALTLGSRRASEAPWIAINDFVLSYVRPRAVLDFMSPWKLPCVFCFAREDAEFGETHFFAGFTAEAGGRQRTTEFVRDSGDRIVPIPRVSGCPVSVETFLSEQNLSLCPEAPRAPITFQPLSPSELLLMQTIRLRREERQRGHRGSSQKGVAPHLPEALGSKADAFFVAMDAEFVAEVTEAAEIDEEGHKHVLQSSSLTLARLTLVRGQGPLEGVPFMDHFVQFTRPPKDCLTRLQIVSCLRLAAAAAAAAAVRSPRDLTQQQLLLLTVPFSGLRLEDLNPNESKAWLATRKAILQKLRYLIDAGCMIYGSVFRHDFRVINLYVPTSQVVDTVELYRLPGKRLLSLKYLAALVLQQNIQVVTHDSIEDAQTALKLFKGGFDAVSDGDEILHQHTFWFSTCFDAHCIREDGKMKYLEMKEQGTLAGCILRLYEMGYHTNWLAPPLNVSVASATAASAAQLLLLSSKEARAAAAATSNSNNEDPNTDEPALQDLLFPHR
ncbi:hypothetical protein ACSSS7_006137 [Eimeria intestinalis]